MREIKFRAWDLLEKRMRYLNKEMVGFRYYEVFCNTPDSRGFDLMQFTGLKDKNDIEIYEGDVVRGSAFEDGDLEIGEVAWFEYCWDISGLITDGEFNDLMEWYAAGNLEVIGNIYENPELLKER